MNPLRTYGPPRETTHRIATLNAPSHPIRNRRLRLTAASPDLLAVMKAESRV
jgi:hypothetical protein